MADSNQGPQNQTPNTKPQGLSWSQPQNKSQKPTTQVVVPEDAGSGGRILAVIIGIIVVVALVVWGITALRHRDAITEGASNMPAGTAPDANGGVYTDTASDTPTTEGVGSAQPGVVVANASGIFSIAGVQAAGKTVEVSSMNLSQATWIIIYDTKGGAPGNILGAGLFFPGDRTGTVPLLRGTTAGQSYFATAAIDTGNRIFSMQNERPILDQNGTQVWTTFSAQ